MTDKTNALRALAEDEDGLPVGFARWYNRTYRTRTADTKHLADCEEAWRAALATAQPETQNAPEAPASAAGTPESGAQDANPARPVYSALTPGDADAARQPGTLAAIQALEDQPQATPREPQTGTMPQGGDACEGVPQRGPAEPIPDTPAQRYLDSINAVDTRDWMRGFNDCAALAAAGPGEGAEAVFRKVVADALNPSGGTGMFRVEYVDPATTRPQSPAQPEGDAVTRVGDGELLLRAAASIRDAWVPAEPGDYDADMKLAAELDERAEALAARNEQAAEGAVDECPHSWADACDCHRSDGNG